MLTKLILLTVVCAIFSVLLMFVPPRHDQRQAKFVAAVVIASAIFMLIAPFIEPLALWITGDEWVGFGWMFVLMFALPALMIGIAEYKIAGWIEARAILKNPEAE